jgi:ABC-type transporter Mla MlaB component
MVELNSTDLLHHRVAGSPTLTNAKEARALLDATFSELEASGADGGHRTIEISLAGVTDGNSVLVSLMLVWMRRARKAGVGILFVDIPPLVSNLIEFTGLDDVLPMARAGAAA